VDSRRAHAVFGVGGLVHNAQRVWCLSATPAPNNASELYIMLRAFGRTTMTYDGFVARYCNCIAVRKTANAKRIQGTNKAMAPELIKMLEPIMLRRNKSQVLKDLPSITFSTVAIESAYDPLQDFPEMKDKLREEWAVLKEKINLQDLNLPDEKLLKAMSVLAPGIATLRRYHGLKKAATCADILSGELENKAYDKVIIFAVHKDVVNMLAKLLKKFGVVKVVGGMSLKNKQKAQDEFQDLASGKRVFIGNILSAGTNINLTAAHQVVFVEEDYVPGNNHQAAMRPHRPPQTMPVTVRAFGLAGFDERITRILTRKTEEIKTFID